MKKLNREVKVEIGNRLRKIRKHLDLNQKQFAAKIDYQQNYLSRYESGESEIPDYLKVFLASDMKVNMNWLLTGEGGMFVDKNNYTTDHFMDAVKEITDMYMVDKEGFKQLIKNSKSIN